MGKAFTAVEDRRCNHNECEDSDARATNTSDRAGELRKVAAADLNVNFVECERWPTGVPGAFPQAWGSKFCLLASLFCLSCWIWTRYFGLFITLHQKAAFEEAQTLQGPIFSTRVWCKKEKQILWSPVGLSGLGARTRDWGFNPAPPLLFFHFICKDLPPKAARLLLITAAVEKSLQINRYKYQTCYPVMDLRHRAPVLNMFEFWGLIFNWPF